MPLAVMFRASRTSLFRAFVLVLTAAMLLVGLPTVAQAETTTELSIAPTALSANPGENLTLTVKLANTGDAVAAGRVFILAPYEPLATVAETAAWFDSAQSPYAGEYLAEVAVPALAAGETAQLSVEFPVTTARFGSAWGPRGLAASYQIRGSEQATARSSFVLTTPTAPVATAFSAVLAVTPPSETSGLLTSPQLSELMSPTGLLTRQLNLAQGRPVALGIDPRIFASISALGASLPAEITQWQELLRSLPNDTFLLPYADADISAQAQAGASSLLSPVTETPAPTPSPAPLTATFTPSLSDIAWPGSATVTGADVSVFQGAGYSRMILSSSNVDRDVSRGIVAGSATAITSEALSAALVSGNLSTASSLLAAAAIDPAAASSMQAAVARNLDNAQLTTLGATIDTLTALSWANSGKLSAVLSSAQGDLSVVDRPESSERISIVSSLLARNAEVAAFARIAEDPTAISTVAEENLSAVLSLSWLGNPDWSAAVEANMLSTSKILTAVSVVTNSTINMVGGQANIPISIHNSLTQPVTIVVSATPNNGRLIVNGTQTLTIQPESQANAKIPVEAQVGNGRVLLTVTLASVDGFPVGEPAVIPINVRADWEGWGLAAVGIAFAALITAGVIRTLRRRQQGQSEDD